MADGELVLRHVRVLPEAAPLALLALIDEPVVIALVDEMAFGRVHGRRAGAAVKLAPERELFLAQLDRLDVGLVSRLFELPAGDRGKDLLVAQAELALVDADVAIARLM